MCLSLSVCLNLKSLMVVNARQGEKNRQKEKQRERTREREGKREREREKGGQEREKERETHRRLKISSLEIESLVCLNF